MSRLNRRALLAGLTLIAAQPYRAYGEDQPPAKTVYWKDLAKTVAQLGAQLGLPALEYGAQPKAGPGEVKLRALPEVAARLRELSNA